MTDEKPPFPLRKRRTWSLKFQDSFRGLALGLFPSDQPLGLNSFCFHFVAASAVLVWAFFVELNVMLTAILVICIGVVFVAELFNTSIERLARAITKESNPFIREALDIASGAVLAASLLAVVVGALILWAHMAMQ